jgi:hypothetical protein
MCVFQRLFILQYNCHTPMPVTMPPTPKIPKGLIAGVSVAGTYYRLGGHHCIYTLVETTTGIYAVVETTPEQVKNEARKNIRRGLLEGNINLLSIHRPYITSESSSVDPVADNPPFSNPMIVASRMSFPPEIQSDNNGNLPIRPTISLASLDRRTVMARHGQDATSNPNSGFYGSAIPTAMNMKPSSKQLYEAPLDQSRTKALKTVNPDTA